MNTRYYYINRDTRVILHYFEEKTDLEEGFSLLGESKNPKPTSAVAALLNNPNTMIAGYRVMSGA